MKTKETTGFCAVKPPLGIMPERLWKERRVWDLIECLARNQAQPIIHGEWLDELRRVLNEIYNLDMGEGMNVQTLETSKQNNKGETQPPAKNL